MIFLERENISLYFHVNIWIYTEENKYNSCEI